MGDRSGEGDIVAIFEPFQTKIGCVQQDFPAAMGIVNGLRYDGFRLVIHTGHIQRLPDMQRTQFAVLIPTVPIVKAIGYVAGLLDLIEQDARADGMHCAGGNIKHIPGLDGHKAQQLFNRLAVLRGG